MISELLLALGVFVALLVYGRIAIDVLARGRGRVSVEGIGFADILLGSVLVALLISMAYVNFEASSKMETQPPPSVSWENVLITTVYAGTLILAIVLSLKTRGVSFARMTNLVGVPVGRALVSAVFLGAFSYPLILATQALLVKHTGADEQIVVQAFRNSSDWSPAIVSACIVAPFFEEIVFRGYLYPLFKRYCGAGFSILACSVLFAVTHGHTPTLAPLFVLAVCLSLAYEISGSLLVPMIIHSLFNTSMVVAIAISASK